MLDGVDRGNNADSAAVWFGVHVIFPPGGNIGWFALVICAIAFRGMLRWKWNVVPVVVGGGNAGLIYKTVFQ